MVKNKAHKAWSCALYSVSASARMAWISSVSPDDREHFGPGFDNWPLNL